ncbi:jg1074 [Pararge aegeria aegeria]|uniref:Jg1074 protein n=1 Tax=Pararge aegeria aegeria TaxID=348720 RepID=A0A8S4QNI8_9NEOP|nr:jg1074 [Pararge aegeria aegeria]
MNSIVYHELKTYSLQRGFTGWKTEVTPRHRSPYIRGYASCSDRCAAVHPPQCAAPQNTAAGLCRPGTTASFAAVGPGKCFLFFPALFPPLRIDKLVCHE